MIRLPIIDNGHGYNTPGKQSIMPNGEIFEEWEFTRIIKLRVISKLFRKRLPFFDLVPEAFDTPLQRRAKEVNEICHVEKKLRPYVISLHGDAFNNKTAHGITIFNAKGLTESDKLSQIAYDSFEGFGWVLREDLLYGKYRGREADFYILRKPICPALLFELGFYTNDKQVMLMNNSEIQEKIADRIVLTIQNINKLT